MSALSSLKAAKKTTLAEELKSAPTPAPVEEPVAAEEAPAEAAAEGAEVDIDVESMTAKQLDELVAQYEIQTPDEWKKWKKAEKAAWLTAQFGADTGDDVTMVEADAPAEAAAEAPVAQAEPELPQEPATKAKGKVSKATPKSTAVATSHILHGDVLSADEFSTTVAEIENLKQKDALDLVGKLVDQSELTLFKLGAVLSRIQEEEWFKDQGFSTFREYIENRHSFGYRTAMYQIGIYKDLVASGVSYTAVSGVPWSKLKEIASVISPENVEEWVKSATDNTIDTLRVLVRNFKSAGKEITEQLSSTAASDVITTLTFKVHTDQKENIALALEKAKAEAKTDVNTVALEYICVAFNSGATGKKGSNPKPAPLKDQLASLGLEGAAQLLIDAFPEETINIAVGDGEDEAA
ncbi:putative ribonuclease E/G family protein [Rhizobium phage RHph_TM16]|nr:putative ribonuclease E/G family protein [Rhizobium phage RHph_TM16]